MIPKFGNFLIGIAGLTFLFLSIRSNINKRQQRIKLSEWLESNNLLQYEEEFHRADINQKEEFANFNVNSHSQFERLSDKQKFTINRAVASIRDLITLEQNLLENGIDIKTESLLRHGIISPSSLMTASEKTLQDFTQHDKTLVQYFKLLKLKESFGLHLPDYNKKMSESAESYSIIDLVSMVFLASAISGAIMLFHDNCTFSRSRGPGNRSNKTNIFDLITGKYPSPRQSVVAWDSSEPDIVGKTQTFSIKFFQKNGGPYPVSDVDNIFVEIMHNGSKVATSIEIGSTDPKQANMARVSFTVHRSGEYNITIMISGCHVAGSPCTKVFEAGPIDASKTGFMNYSSTIVCTCDTSYPLTIETRDSYGNLAAYKADQNNYFKIKVTEAGTDKKYVPATQIIYDPHNKCLTMHIKMETVGCYKAVVSYGDRKLKNGEFNILVLSVEESCRVNKNIAKKNTNIWYEARLISYNNEFLEKPKKVFVYVTPKQLKLKEFYLKIIGMKLCTFRVCPSTKFHFNGYNNRYDAPVFTIDDGAQPPIKLAAKDRTIIAATFTNYLLKNIGGSETFKDKQTFFNHEIRQLHSKRNHDRLPLKINRSKLLQSSFKATKHFDVNDWCKNFEITFQGEEGLDYGGLRREWFEVLSTELFDPAGIGLFTRFSDDSQGLVHPNHHRPADMKLKTYEFAGKIVGKCLFESALGGTYKQMVKARFTRSFLAQLIGLRVHYKHFETDDPELYKTKIQYVEEKDIEGMDLSFSEEEYNSSGGLTRVVELIPNGSRTPVVNKNKLRYLDLLAQYKLASSIREELEYFLKGLNEIIPDNLLSIFDENELELLMCGTGNYSITDFKEHHTTSGSSSAFRKVLEWFWTIIASFTEEQLARLLQFTTGCSQLPPGGFTELCPNFQITSSHMYNTLPTAHTCFNQLCLPEYDTIEQFHRSLLIAINEGNQGFGLV